MSAPRLTGSRLSLARKCLHWAGPQAPDENDPRAGKAASEGTAAHACFEAHLIAKRRIEPAEVCAALDAPSYAVDGAIELYEAAAEFLDRLPDVARAEVAYAFDTATGQARALEPEFHRDYSACTASEIPTTADVVWIEPGPDGARVVVADWQTGYTRYKGAAREYLPLHFQALCAARHLGAREALVEIWHVDKDTGVSRDAHPLSATDLDGVAFEVSMLADATKQTHPPKPGEHCRWCPIVASCEATTKQLAAIAPDDGDRELSIAIRDAAHAAWTIERLSAARNALTKIEAAVKAFADEHGPIPVSGGKVWGPREIATEWIATDRDALATLRGYLGDDDHALDRVAPRKCTKTLLRKELGAKAAREAIDVLREAGAVKLGTSKRYDAYKAAPELVESE